MGGSKDQLAGVNQLPSQGWFGARWFGGVLGGVGIYSLQEPGLQISKPPIQTIIKAYLNKC